MSSLRYKTIHGQHNRPKKEISYRLETHLAKKCSANRKIGHECRPQ
jgi:hypothetical protein